VVALFAYDGGGAHRPHLVNPRTAAACSNTYQLCLGRRSVFHHSGEIIIHQLEQALLLAQQQNNIAEIGHSLWALGHIAYKNQQFILALKYYEQCLTYYHQLDDPFYIADGFIWVGLCHCCLGHLDEADRYVRQNLDLRPSFGDKNGEFYARLYRSNLLLLSGNYDGAEPDLNAAFTITQSDDPACTFFWSHACNGGSLLMRDTWLGFLALIRGDHETAQLYRHALLRSADDLLMVNARTYLLHLVGFAITLDGDYQQGAQLLDWVCHHFSLNAWFERPIVYWGLSLAKVGLEADMEAQQWLAVLFEAGLMLNSAMLLTLGLPVQAVILARNGEPTRAVELLSLAFIHPKSAKGWMERWPVLQQVQANLHAELGADAYSAAWKRGALLDVETVCRDLLAVWQSADLPTLSNHRHPDMLTSREQEVLRLIARGHSNREIADALILSVGTVKGYVYNVCQKLGVQNRTHAVARAREQNIL
jgi:DNA-binding CsgD family transcriptional regulator